MADVKIYSERTPPCDCTVLKIHVLLSDTTESGGSVTLETSDGDYIKAIARDAEQFNEIEARYGDVAGYAHCNSMAKIESALTSFYRGNGNWRREIQLQPLWYRKVIPAFGIGLGTLTLVIVVALIGKLLT